MTKTEKAKADIIAMLLAIGWEADGATREETVRVPTTRCPLYGKSGGELATFGGRTRLRLPDTDRRVTVGSRTTCFYRVADGKTSEYVNFKTMHESATIRAEALKGTEHGNQ